MSRSVRCMSTSYPFLAYEAALNTSRMGLDVMTVWILRQFLGFVNPVAVDPPSCRFRHVSGAFGHALRVPR